MLVKNKKVKIVDYLVEFTTVVTIKRKFAHSYMFTIEKVVLLNKLTDVIILIFIKCKTCLKKEFKHYIFGNNRTVKEEEQIIFT